MDGRAGVCGFAECAAPARRLAAALSLPFRLAEVHRFPDGERLVRVAGGWEDVIVYRSLNDAEARDPDDKLLEVLFAASALRDQGARRLTLVAPYLGYMRQDIAFHPGEAVTQKVMGGLIGAAFDRVLSVDPHLHRTHSLAEAIPGAEAQAITAAPVLADLLADLPADLPGADGAAGAAVLIGPDVESGALVRAVAEPLGLTWITGEKVRRGDREVSIRLSEAACLKGRVAVLVDDVVSSGATMMECARLALAAGARRVEALTVHALYPAAREAELRAAGIARLRSTDSLPHPSNAAPLAPLLAPLLASVLTPLLAARDAGES